MDRTLRIFISIFIIIQLASCSVFQSNKIIDDNLVLDYDWQADIYNMALVEATDTDNLRVQVKQGPGFFGGSPHQLACVEIAQPMEPNRFYIANLNFYSLIEVKNCNIDFWVPTNLVDPAHSRMAGADQMNAMISGHHNSVSGPMKWENIPGVSEYYVDSSHLRLFFDGLFPVNQYHLTSSGHETLLLITKKLLHKNIVGMIIYGVADSTGGYSTNRSLADARARTVKDFLVNEGIDNVQFDLRGSVENALKIQENRKKQRRFMIEVIFK